MYTLILWIEYMIRTNNVWDKEWYTLEEFTERARMLRKPDYEAAILTDIIVLGIIGIIITVTLYIKEVKSSSKSES